MKKLLYASVYMCVSSGFAYISALIIFLVHKDLTYFYNETLQYSV